MYRVFIVDDEPIICKGLRDTIEWDALGLEISGEARNGVDALAMIQTLQPHILITDIRMPGMDGITLIKAVRELGLPIKIIILSGYSDFVFLKEAIRLGVDGYLLKPIDLDELISNLTDLVSRIEKETLRTDRLYQGIELLRANTLNRLVTNAISRGEFEEKASFLGLSLEAERYLCAVCAADSENGDILAYGEPVASCALRRMDQALSDGRGVAFIDAKNRLVLLLMGGGDENLADIAVGLLGSFVALVGERFGKTMLTNVGSPVSTLEEIWKSYEDATEPLDHTPKAEEGEASEGKWRNAVDRTLAYIDVHYHDALSLKQVAFALDINTSYLGQIFKKATNESFTDYVNQYRIQKAKELLSRSNLKVYEVAGKVGFTDYHYFLKIFKKITGLNPTDTRC